MASTEDERDATEPCKELRLILLLQRYLRIGTASFEKEEQHTCTVGLNELPGSATDKGSPFFRFWPPEVSSFLFVMAHSDQSLTFGKSRSYRLAC